ncbi:MAG: hypothetical protein J6D36_06080 [Erysipelotrichaceae bacterium]|nr:hypothetical protein [Erysipelotrichaceae bacterium]
MNRNKLAMILSFVAAGCFFVSYLAGSNVIQLILGLVWLVIGYIHWTNLKNKS